MNSFVKVISMSREVLMFAKCLQLIEVSVDVGIEQRLGNCIAINICESSYKLS
jgi:hypothetical protein